MLKDYQIKHANLVSNALETYGIAADNSDTGTGKTWVACHIGQNYKHVVVVCPKSVIPAWREVAEYYKLDGTAINYEMIKKDKELGFWKIRNRKWEWTLPNDSLLIFDEAHRLAGQTSQNSKLLIAAKRQGIPTLMLSATLADNPIKMKAIGFALDLFDLEDYRWWLPKVGVIRDHFGAYKYTGGKKAMQLIRSEIGSRMHGMKYKEIKDFPENNIFTRFIPVTKNPDSAYEIAVEMLRRRADTASVEAIRARQLSELHKVSSFIDMTHNALSEGRSVVLFVNYRDTLAQLLGQLSKYSPSVIIGGQSDTERKTNIERFNTNKTFVIISMVQAGGVGISLHDLYGRQREAIISPPFSSVDFKQALGRIHRHGSKSPAIQYICYAQGSAIESEMKRKIESKLNNLDALNDNDLNML